MECSYKLKLSEEEYVFSSKSELNTFIHKNYNRLRYTFDGMSKLKKVVDKNNSEIRIILKKIKRNKNGEVLAPNGKPSELYKQLEKVYGPDAIVNYAITKTEHFKKYYGSDVNSYFTYNDRVSIGVSNKELTPVGNMSDLINHVVSQDDSVARFISSLNIDNDIKVFSTSGSIIVDGKVANGFYDDDKNVLVIKKDLLSDHFDVYNLIHEIVHAATVRKVKRLMIDSNTETLSVENTRLREQLSSISKTVKDYLTANKEGIAKKYGINNDDLIRYFRADNDMELIANLLSDTDLIKIAKDIPSYKNERNRSIWDDILDFFSNLFGFDIRNTVIEDAMSFLQECSLSPTIQRPLIDSNGEPVFFGSLSTKNYIDDVNALNAAFAANGEFNLDDYQIIIEEKQISSMFLQEVKKDVGEFDKQSEIHSLLQSIKRDNEDYAKLSYNKETGEKEVNVTNRLVHEGYVGVNRRIDQYRTSEGARVVAEFNKDNYVNFYVKQQLEELKKTDKLSGKSEEQITKELTEEAITNVKNWEILADLGSDIHKIAEVFFGEDINTVEGIRTRTSLAYHDSTIEACLNALSTFRKSLEKNYGKLKFITELKVHNPESKTVGIIDLVAIDKSGKAHVFDFKASYKDTAEWNHNKVVKIGYQLAVYKRMLQAKGISVASVDILPIKLHNIDYDSRSIGQVEGESVVAYSHMITGRKFFNVASSLIPLPNVQFSASFEAVESVKKQMKDNFGYELQAKATITNVD